MLTGQKKKKKSRGRELSSDCTMLTEGKKHGRAVSNS